MMAIEFYSFWIAISFYVFAFSLFVYSLIKKQEIKLAYYTAVCGLVFHLITGLSRWSIANHPPHFGTYENTLTTSWFVVLFALIVMRKYKLHQLFGALALSFTLLMLAYSLKWDNAHLPLTISERTIWLDFHATFAWLAYGSYTVAFCLGMLYLFASRQKTLSSKINDELIFKYQLYGFINQTFMMATGMYYGNLLFGRWWQWDPIQSMNLIVWLMFGLAIHIRLFFGWKEKKAAWLMVSFFALFLISYWAIDFFPGHSTFHKFNLTEGGWTHPE